MQHQLWAPMGGIRVSGWMDGAGAVSLRIRCHRGSVVLCDLSPTDLVELARVATAQVGRLVKAKNAAKRTAQA